ncbi:hypothetical protein [Streptomyces anulatus]|uniref:hypothetical protein n=1 Tax=Streptomyces anulatus TaxID=1892 RepID=UPI001995B835|nr:hypothetical protein [Streptomyces anulatus]GGY77234.1 hypothetical protein GCM10010342_76220 [Streptomyces anulatus]
MRYLEGTPEEIAEFLRLTGTAADSGSVETAAEETADVLVSSTNMDEMEVSIFINDRGRTDEGKARVKQYLDRLRGVEIVTGRSTRTKDGQTDYLMVRDDGVRRYGAVAYVKPANCGLTLRLTREDVADLATDFIQFRDVKEGHKYVVNCPLISDEAVEWAVQLTHRALVKVRGTK